MRRSWRAGADCKSVGLSLRWFESTHSHQNINTRQMAGIYILSCGIWIRPYNRQIVWFGTSALARSERGPPQFIAVGITIHPLPPKHKPTGWSVFVLCWDKNLLFFCVFLVQLWVNPVGTLVRCFYMPAKSGATWQAVGNMMCFL